MQTIIIITLVYFLLKKKKPHVHLVVGVAKSFSYLGKLLVKLWQSVTHFWALFFMEISASNLSKEEAEAMRADYSAWAKWTSQSKKEITHYWPDEPRRNIEKRLTRYSWTDTSCAHLVGDGVGIFSVITMVIVFVAGLTTLISLFVM